MYKCSAKIGNKTYEYDTVSAKILHDAFDEYRDYLWSEFSVDLDDADGLVIDEVENV